MRSISSTIVLILVGCSAAPPVGQVRIDPCSEGFTVPGVDLERIEDIAIDTEVAAEVGFDVDGLTAMADSMVDDASTFCGLPVSPEVTEAIERARSAVTRGDGDAARQEISQALAELLTGLIPVTGYHAADGSDGLQDVRDALALAGQAAEQGDDDLADDALGQATDAFGEYAEGALEGATTVEEALEIAAQAEALGDDETRDAAMERARQLMTAEAERYMEGEMDGATLLDLAAQAYLLGLDELAEELMDEVRKIAQSELDAILKDFWACAATKPQAEALARALARAELVGAETAAGFQAYDEWYDIQRRRARGEAVPECDRYRIESIEPITSPLQGERRLQLSTCDGVTWTGTLTFSADSVVEGVKIVATSETSFSITVDPKTGRGSTEVTDTRTQHIDAPEGVTGEGTVEASGTIELAVDLDRQTATITISFDAASGTMRITTPEGSISRPISGESWSNSITEPLRPNPACGSS